MPSHCCETCYIRLHFGKNLITCTKRAPRRHICGVLDKKKKAAWARDACLNYDSDFEWLFERTDESYIFEIAKRPTTTWFAGDEQVDASWYVTTIGLLHLALQMALCPLPWTAISRKGVLVEHLPCTTNSSWHAGTWELVRCTITLKGSGYRWKRQQPGGSRSHGV